MKVPEQPLTYTHTKRKCEIFDYSYVLQSNSVLFGDH